MAVRYATPWSQSASASGLRIDAGLRASARKVAWKASSASARDEDGERGLLAAGREVIEQLPVAPFLAITSERQLAEVPNDRLRLHRRHGEMPHAID
jgi:hypothetical protein